MLNFAKAVQADNLEVAVYVFVDAEKGHTVYVSHNGSMTVVEDDKKTKGTQRAAGFLVNNDCSDCNGC